MGRDFQNDTFEIVGVDRHGLIVNKDSIQNFYSTQVRPLCEITEKTYFCIRSQSTICIP